MLPGGVIVAGDPWLHVFALHTALTPTFNINDAGVTVGQLHSAVWFDDDVGRTRGVSQDRHKVAAALSRALAERLRTGGARLRSCSALLDLLQVWSRSVDLCYYSRFDDCAIPRWCVSLRTGNVFSRV